MRISDWSSDVCSSDLPVAKPGEVRIVYGRADKYDEPALCAAWGGSGADKSDARMMMHALTEKRMGYAFPSMEVEQRPSLTEELEARGDRTSTRLNSSH